MTLNEKEAMFVDISVKELLYFLCSATVTFLIVSSKSTRIGFVQCVIAKNECYKIKLL